MNKNKIRASSVLKLISLGLTIIGLFFLSRSIFYLLNLTVETDPTAFKLLLLGIVLFIIGVVGPARIIANGALIPSEIKQTIMVQAVFLPALGAVLIMAELINTPMSLFVGLLIAACLTFISTYFGFYYLSNKLPQNFYIGEMLSIIKSASISGDKKDSPANRAFMKWTAGKREGVALGEQAPNAGVVMLDGKKVTLASLFNANKSAFTVINFASYTCPHHRKRIAELKNVMDKWQSKNVSFLTVYTAEAHPNDGWKLEHQYDADDEYINEDDFCFNYAKTIEERINMAKWLVDKKAFAMPIVVDMMDDTLLKSYNTWPIRLYIIQNGSVVYCGDQGPFGYEPKSVDNALHKLTNRQ